MQPPRRADSVPKELVGKYVKEFCDLFPDNPRATEGFITPYEMLADRSGYDYSYIWKLARGMHKWDVSFDATDRIFCAMGRPNLWHCDPELKDIYERVVAEADRLKPIEMAA